MFAFGKIWHALFSYNTRFKTRSFTLLPKNYSFPFLEPYKNIFYFQKILIYFPFHVKVDEK